MSLPPTLELCLDEHCRAIETCLQRDLVLPAVVLVYTVIDSLAFLARPTEEVRTGPDYESWVREYLLDGPDGHAGAPEKTARDLYGARCAILDTTTAESNLTAHPDPARRAREVYYPRHTGEAGVPLQSANTPESALFVDPDALAVRLVQAIGRFRRAAGADAVLRERVERRSTHYLYRTRGLTSKRSNAAP